MGGVITIVRRNRLGLSEFNFALFMESAVNEFAELWHSHLRGQMFVFLEKRLQHIRILFLKMERILFNVVHGLRGIKEKNSNGQNGNDNGNFDETLK